MTFYDMVKTLPIERTQHTYLIGDWVYNKRTFRGYNRKTRDKWHGEFYTMLIEKKLIDVDEIIIKHYANTTTY